MTRPMHRSRTFRRVFRKTPGARVVLHHRRRKPNGAHCAECGKTLLAVPRALPYQMENMAKSSKRPERAFGGRLCSPCARRQVIGQARALA